jgi:23S rRNA pseudouridine955/2504/2580 synthase
VRVVDAPLERNQLKSGERMVKVSGEGKAAESRFKILQHLRSATLLSIQIVSGRTHQIRVHAQLVGHPLAGDEKYGDDDANRELRKQGLKRIFLHAGRVQFRHPISGDLVEVTADLPEDLQNVVQGLS